MTVRRQRRDASRQLSIDSDHHAGGALSNECGCGRRSLQSKTVYDFVTRVERQHVVRKRLAVSLKTEQVYLIRRE